MKSPRAQFACLVPAPPAPPPPPPPPPSACTFQPNCDYGHGSRDRAPAGSKEECCTLCQAHAGCVAGVLTGGECFFKTAQDVEGGCVKSSRAQFGCLTPFVKQLAIMEKKYSALLNTTCAAVAAKAPALPTTPSPTSTRRRCSRPRRRCSRSPPSRRSSPPRTASPPQAGWTPRQCDAPCCSRARPPASLRLRRSRTPTRPSSTNYSGAEKRLILLGVFPIHGCLFCCAEPVLVNESVSTITKTLKEAVSAGTRC